MSVYNNEVSSGETIRGSTGAYRWCSRLANASEAAPATVSLLFGQEIIYTPWGVRTPIFQDTLMIGPPIGLSMRVHDIYSVLYGIWSFDFRDVHWICCHQMSHFDDKTH